MKSGLKATDGSQHLEEIAPELLGIPVNLNLRVPRSFQESLKRFMKEHGLDPKFDLRKIFEYGLVQESDEELKIGDREARPLFGSKLKICNHEIQSLRAF